MRVFGIGAPDIPEPQLEICSAGPNGIPEGCAPGSDDVFLGAGGTNGAGNFEQGGSAGIGLNRGLIAGEMVFAIDLQHGLNGPAVPVKPTPPIPDVNPWGAAALATALLIAIATRLRLARIPRTRGPR